MIKEISLRTIVHATESNARVLEAIQTLLPKAEIKEIHTTGYYGNEILIIEAFSQDCSVAENLLLRDGLFEEVVKNPQLHIDKGVVYLKVDKQVLYAQKKLTAVGLSKDAISIKLRIGSKNEPREKTANRIREFLRSVR